VPPLLLLVTLLLPLSTEDRKNDDVPAPGEDNIDPKFVRNTRRVATMPKANNKAVPGPDSTLVKYEPVLLVRLRCLLTCLTDEPAG